MEAAYVFDRAGNSIFWHVPPGRSEVYIPDSRDLWDVLWDGRESLGGVAHSHPWDGIAQPSQTDLTTFAAVEEGLGKRLVWPIATFTNIIYLEWCGPDRLDYARLRYRRFRLKRHDVEKLISISGGPEWLTKMESQRHG